MKIIPMQFSSLYTLNGMVRDTSGSVSPQYDELSNKLVKGNNPPSTFFSKTLSLTSTIQFVILFSETIIISQTKSWVSQNNIKYKSEFE